MGHRAAIKILMTKNKQVHVYSLKVAAKAAVGVVAVVFFVCFIKYKTNAVFRKEQEQLFLLIRNAQSSRISNLYKTTK